MKGLVYTLLISTLIFSSCDSKSTDPQDPGFILEVVAVDVAGDPVGGLQVSMQNMLTIPLPLSAIPLEVIESRPAGVPGVCPDEYRLRPNSPNPFNTTTSMVIDHADGGTISVTLHSLSGDQIFEEVRTRDTCGAFTQSLDPADPWSTAYEVRVRIEDSTGILFEGSAYIVHLVLDPESNAVGFTRSDGRLFSRDSTRFPCLFDLGEQIRTTEFGDVSGTFSYVDSARITLTDTTLDLHQNYSVEIRPGFNRHRLVWDP